MLGCDADEALTEAGAWIGRLALTVDVEPTDAPTVAEWAPGEDDVREGLF